MKNSPHGSVSAGSRAGAGADAARSRVPLGAPALKPMATAQQACCCQGRPAVLVLLPRAHADGAVTELLLCARHFRRSVENLDAAGAAVFNSRGALVMPTSWRFPVDALTIAWWSDELYDGED